MTCQANMSTTKDAGESSNQQCTNCGAASAGSWCLDCNEALCDDCLLAHRRVSLTRFHRIHNHQLEEHNLMSPTKFCRLHPSELLKIFCYTCKQLTCRDCQLVAHMNHRFQFVSEAVETLKKQLDMCIQPLTEQMNESYLSLQKMEMRLNLLDVCEKHMMERIRKNFLVLTTFLKIRMEHIVKDLQQVLELDRERMKTKMLQVKELNHNCKLVTKAAEDALKTSDPMTLFAHVAQIMPQAKGLVDQDSSPPPTMCNVKVTCEKQSVELIKNFGQLHISWIPFSVPQISQNLVKTPSTITTPPTTDLPPGYHQTANHSVPVCNIAATSTPSISVTPSNLYNLSSSQMGVHDNTNLQTGASNDAASAGFRNSLCFRDFPVTSPSNLFSSITVGNPTSGPITTNSLLKSAPPLSHHPSSQFPCPPPQTSSFSSLDPATSSCPPPHSSHQFHTGKTGDAATETTTLHPIICRSPQSDCLSDPISLPSCSSSLSTPPATLPLPLSSSSSLVTCTAPSHTAPAEDHPIRSLINVITKSQVADSCRFFHWKLKKRRKVQKSADGKHTSQSTSSPSTSSTISAESRNPLSSTQASSSSSTTSTVTLKSPPKPTSLTNSFSAKLDNPLSSTPAISSSFNSVFASSTTHPAPKYWLLPQTSSRTLNTVAVQPVSAVLPQLAGLSPLATTNIPVQLPLVLNQLPVINQSGLAMLMSNNQSLNTLMDLSGSVYVVTPRLQGALKISPVPTGFQALPWISRVNHKSALTVNGPSSDQWLSCDSGTCFRSLKDRQQNCEMQVETDSNELRDQQQEHDDVITAVSKQTEPTGRETSFETTEITESEDPQPRGKLFSAETPGNPLPIITSNESEPLGEPFSVGPSDNELVSESESRGEPFTLEASDNELLMESEPAEKPFSPENNLPVIKSKDPEPKGKPFSPENNLPILRSKDPEPKGKPFSPENNLPVLRSKDPEPKGKPFSPETSDNELAIKSEPFSPENKLPIIESEDPEPKGKPFSPENKPFVIKSKDSEHTGEPFSPETSEDELVSESESRGEPFTPETSDNKLVIMSEPSSPENKPFVIKSKDSEHTGEPFSPETSEDELVSESESRGEPFTPETSDNKLVIMSEPSSPENKPFVIKSKDSEHTGEPFSPETSEDELVSESESRGEPFTPETSDNKLVIMSEPSSPENKPFVIKSKDSEHTGEPFSPETSEDELVSESESRGEPFTPETSDNKLVIMSEPSSPENKPFVIKSKDSEHTGEPFSPETSQDELVSESESRGEPFTPETSDNELVIKSEPSSPENKPFVIKSKDSEHTGEPFSPETSEDELVSESESRGEPFTPETSDNELVIMSEPSSPENKLFVIKSKDPEPKGKPFSPENKLFVIKSKDSEHTGEPFSPETSEDELMIIKSEPTGEPFSPEDEVPIKFKPIGKPFFPKTLNTECIILSDESQSSCLQSDTETSDSESEEPVSSGNPQQDTNLFQWEPRVSLTRLPLSLPGQGCPLPHFRLILGEEEDEIYLEEIMEDSQSSSVSNGNTNNSDNACDDESDVTKDFTSPLTSPESPMSVEILSCSACGSSGASKICSACGRGYHRDCHVPPVGADIWSEWICSLCQDLLDPSDPYSTDRPETPQSGCLSLQDQRKCETLLLHLKVEGCSRVSESGFWSDLMLLSERLTQYSPPYRSAGQLVSDIWTLFEDVSQTDVFKELQQSFQEKLVEVLGSELHPSLLIAPNADTPSSPGSPASLLGSDLSDAEEEASAAAQERRLTESRLKDVKKRLKDFLDTKTQHLAKRAKRE